MNTSLKNLKSLRTKLHSGKMSILVGSGFSKNASEKFPNWTELLQDLVIELYPREFEPIFSIKSKTKREFQTREKVNLLISEVGYLDLVSKYIEKKGFEESICTYIEDNVPLLERNENQTLYIEHKGEREALDETSLEIHRNLVNLKWNNIYTTNYDQLLDFCADEHANTKLQQEIEVIAKKMFDKKDRVKDIQNEVDSKANNQTDPFNTHKFSPIDGTIDISILKIEQNRLIAEIKRHEIQIHEKESQKHLLKKVITDESELALKHQNNIIKLHGSLRTAKQRSKSEFGFSGDPFAHYIISKEHYQSYEDKHSAFMHLMRISLLQESFCLIGFSGDDPNFKAWLSWVKSILSRKAIKELKVYFIDLGDGTKITKDKKLFFDNNSIGIISLRSTEVLQELGLEGSNNTNNLLLTEFINFLNDNKNTTSKDYDTSLTNRYKTTWNKIENWEGKKVYDLERLKDLEEIKANDAIFPITETTKQILESISFTLSNSIDKFYLETRDARWYRLFAHAVEDLRIPSSLVQDEFSGIDLDFDEPNLKRVTQFDEVFSGNIHHLNSENHFLKLMSIAYSYDFDCLYNFVCNQEVQAEYPIAASSILALFSPENAFNFLLNFETTQCHLSKKLLIKKLLYAYYRQYTYTINNDLETEINKIEKNGIFSVFEEIEKIAKEYISKREKPQLIGANRHGVSTTITLTNRPTNLGSVHYVYSLFKIGLQQNTLGTYLIPDEDWYKIHIGGFEEYPIPYLFYSLQCNDEKILKRISQDYAYNLNIKDCLANIVKNLLIQSNLQSEKVTNKLKSNLLIFCTEILISIPPEEWQDFFFQHLESNINYFNRKSKIISEFLELLLRSLLYTTKKQHLIKTLEMLLLDDSLEMTLKITYGVTSNKNVLLNAHAQTKVLKQSINSLISNIENNFENNLFLLGNLRDLLTKNQLKKIREKIEKIDIKQFKYVKILRTIALFGPSETLKKGILNSRKLWYSGIEGNTYAPDEFISLSLFKLRNKNLIDWKKNELITIYHKLIPELEKITEYLRKRESSMWGISGIKELLHEMHRFLLMETKDLNSIDTYSETVTKVKYAYFQLRGYDNISQAIYSEDESIVSNSLREMDSLVYFSGFEQYLNEINLIINRIILEAGSKSRVEQCLFYIGVWLRRDKLYNIESLHTPILTMLKKFSQKEDFEDYDLPFIYQEMISIAQEMQVIGKEMNVINFWLNKKEKKTFNNL